MGDIKDYKPMLNPIIIPISWIFVDWNNIQNKGREYKIKQGQIHFSWPSQGAVKTPKAKNIIAIKKNSFLRLFFEYLVIACFWSIGDWCGKGFIWDEPHCLIWRAWQRFEPATYGLEVLSIQNITINNN